MIVWWAFSMRGCAFICALLLRPELDLVVQCMWWWGLSMYSMHCAHVHSLATGHCKLLVAMCVFEQGAVQWLGCRLLCVV